VIHETVFDDTLYYFGNERQIRDWPIVREGATENARPENAGDWKITDNFAKNRRVWKMQDWKMTEHVN